MLERGERIILEHYHDRTDDTRHMLRAWTEWESLRLCTPAVSVWSLGCNYWELVFDEQDMAESNGPKAERLQKIPQWNPNNYSAFEDFGQAFRSLPVSGQLEMLRMVFGKDNYLLIARDLHVIDDRGILCEHMRRDNVARPPKSAGRRGRVSEYGTLTYRTLSRNWNKRRGEILAMLLQNPAISENYSPQPSSN